MGITKAVNSKANIRQNTSADLPTSIKQPVLARYAAESTANQTVITFPFSIDTVNNPDALIVSVDGKWLTPGSTNDYTFTGIDVYGFSNTITLTQAVAAGLNIQALKLGMKKETEFVQDARFNDVYSNLDESLQGFVSTSSLMSATTSAGSPAAGTFYSSISNRASIVELRNDLKSRMGVERIMTQQLYQIPTESGPSNEMVYGIVNDSLNQIRCVGSGWVVTNDISGMRVGTTTAGNYVEITFYGTGLNLLTILYTNTQVFTYSVDGGSTSNVMSASNFNGVLTGRLYTANQILPIVSGLTQGVHTIKLTVSASDMPISGFEILNETTSVKVNPGISYKQGKKISNQSISTLSYNSTFESGTLGTRGGRVLVYQKADGTIAKAVQPVDSSSQTLSSASHVNEEVARVYHWREFSAGRFTAADDFSSLTTTTASKAFVLDDNITALNGSSVLNNTATEDKVIFGTNGAYLTITFVGTGLDFVRRDTASGGADTFTYSIDGNTATTFSSTGTGIKFVQKIVSGLPYGTHTVTIARSSAPTTYDTGIVQFIVYQPKKPTLPSGAIELADYNILADFNAPGISGSFNNMGTGVLKKSAFREFYYIGSWTATANNSYPTGGYVANSTTGESCYHTFFGTGVQLRLNAPTGTNVTISIDGNTNLSSYITGFSSNVTATFTQSTGVFAVSAGANNAFINITGIPLGNHTIKLLTNNATVVQILSADIIAPVHSHKSNLSGEFQNTLAIGNTSISDNRKFSAIKEAISTKKPWSQSIGVNNAPTTASTIMIPAPDLSTTIKTSGGELRISYKVSHTNSGAGTNYFQVYVDGIAVGTLSSQYIPVASAWMTNGDTIIIPVAAGFHKVELYWMVSAGTGTLVSVMRDLIVEEKN